MAKRKRNRKTGPEIDKVRHNLIAMISLPLVGAQVYATYFSPGTASDRVGLSAILCAVFLLVCGAFVGSEIVRSRKQFTAGGAPMESASAFHSCIALVVGLALCAIATFFQGQGLVGLAGKHHELNFADAISFFGRVSLVVALSLFERRRLDGAMRVRVWFDSVIILLTFATFSWYFLGGKTLTLDHHAVMARAVECIFPLLDIAFVGALLAQTAQVAVGSRNIVFRNLTCGVGFNVAAHSINYYSRFVVDVDVPTIANVLRVAGAVLLVRAMTLEVSRIRYESTFGTQSATGFDPSPYRTPLWRNLLPVIMIPVAAVLVIIANQGGFSYLAVGANVCGGLLVTLVAGRQVFAFGENRSLYQCLLDSHRGLENIVERRTRELHRSNSALLEEIQSRTHTENQLRDAIRRAEDLAKAKSMFLANMSHEIRTPMNGVLGMIQLLSDTTINDEQFRYVNTAKQSTEALLRIIDDILNFSKIEAGKVTIEIVPTDIVKLSEEVISLMQPAASNRSIELRLEAAGGVACTVGGDSVRIRQVLMNLTGNAIKFTEQGSVTIAISATDSPEHLRFDVRDTGIGIPEDRQAAIFESFTQVDGTTTRRFGGTGLGTTISKQLVELMGGEIGLTSVLGEGSTFWFQIKFGAVAGTAIVDEAGYVYEIKPDARLLQIAGVEAETARDDLHAVGPRVLVVEDNPVNQMVAKNLLKKIGARIETAIDGSEAIELVFEREYDIVLMDVQMPIMGGIEATQLIREWERDGGRRRLPIVALTANAMDEDRDICINAGMDDFLSKPVRKGDLVALLDRWAKPMDEMVA